MHKKVICGKKALFSAILGIFFFPAASIAQTSTSTVPQASREKNMSLNLEPAEGVSGSAEAMIRVREENMLDDVSINISADITEQTSGSQSAYEAWLIDTENGYQLSLGVLNSGSSGEKELEYEAKMLSFGAYDQVAVSSESYDDADPRPGKIIMRADITEAESNPADTRAQDQTPGTTTQNQINMENAQWFRAELDSENLQGSDSQANGAAIFVVDTENNVIRFAISAGNLEGRAQRIRIYESAQNAGNGQPVLEAQVQDDQMPVRGQVNYTEENEQSIGERLKYIIVSTDRYPEGEISGQIEEIQVKGQ